MISRSIGGLKASEQLNERDDRLQKDNVRLRSDLENKKARIEGFERQVSELKNNNDSVALQAELDKCKEYGEKMESSVVSYKKRAKETEERAKQSGRAGPYFRAGVR